MSSSKPSPAPDTTIRIGISSCLLGEFVRYDAGHKRDAFLADTLGGFVEWVPVCPEVECGLGTPRESIRLVRTDGGVRLLTVKTSVDLTEQMARYTERRVAELAREGLSGYVFKKDSPSCGVFRVKVHEAGAMPDRSGRGLFAAAIAERFPHLPIEEEGRLSDPHLRENFIERLFAYRRLQDLFAGRWTINALVRFHTAHKLSLMAHALDGYRRLGRLVAEARSLPRGELQERYTADFMATLAVMATPRKHANVLQHMAGHLKRYLDAASKAELQASIDDYRRELVPLVVPLTLMRHYVRAHDISYLAEQKYLEPHPKELMLRNHV